MEAMRQLEILGRLGRQILFDSTAEVPASVTQQQAEHHRNTLEVRHLLLDSRYHGGG